MTQHNNYSECFNVGKTFEVAFQKFCRINGWLYSPRAGVGTLTCWPKPTMNVCLEYRGKPFFSAHQHTGLYPTSAIPINVDKIRMVGGISGFIIMKDYRPHFEDSFDLLWLQKSKLDELIEDNPHRVHTYKTRDGSGHSRQSFYVADHECVAFRRDYFETIERLMKGLENEKTKGLIQKGSSLKEIRSVEAHQ
jgi:hypothetical protein